METSHIALFGLFVMLKLPYMKILDLFFYDFGRVCYFSGITNKDIMLSKKANKLSDHAFIPLISLAPCRVEKVK